MGFIDKYVRSVNSSDLRDDEQHSATDPLKASAQASLEGDFGAMLVRLKFASPVAHDTFEAGTQDLAAILREWESRVIIKGKERGWVKMDKAWDVDAAYRLFTRVAHASLAHWLDDRCLPCQGAGQTRERRICECCKGSGKIPLPAGGYEREKTLDMVSELHDIAGSYQRRAAAALRKE